MPSVHQNQNESKGISIGKGRLDDKNINETEQVKLRRYANFQLKNIDPDTCELICLKIEESNLLNVGEKLLKKFTSTYKKNHYGKENGDKVFYDFENYLTDVTEIYNKIPKKYSNIDIPTCCSLFGSASKLTGEPVSLVIDFLSDNSKKLVGKKSKDVFDYFDKNIEKFVFVRELHKAKPSIDSNVCNQLYELAKEQTPLRLTLITNFISESKNPDEITSENFKTYIAKLKAIDSKFGIRCINGNDFDFIDNSINEEIKNKIEEICGILGNNDFEKKYLKQFFVSFYEKYKEKDCVDIFYKTIESIHTILNDNKHAAKPLSVLKTTLDKQDKEGMEDNIFKEMLSIKLGINLTDCKPLDIGNVTEKEKEFLNQYATRLDRIYKKLGVDNGRALVDRYLYNLFKMLIDLQSPQPDKNGFTIFKEAIENLDNALEILRDKQIKVNTPLASLKNLKDYLINCKKSSENYEDYLAMGFVNEIVGLYRQVSNFPAFSLNIKNPTVTMSVPVYDPSGILITDVDILLEFKHNETLCSIAFEIKSSDKAFITKYEQDKRRGDNKTQPAKLLLNFQGLNEYVVVPCRTAPRNREDFNNIIEDIRRFCRVNHFTMTIISRLESRKLSNLNLPHGN